MISKYILLSLGLLFSLFIHGQNVTLLNDVPIFKDGKRILNPFTGGLKAGQFSSVDIDGDGKKDLFVFDRNSEIVSTYINKGGVGEINYEYAPEYADLFPKPRTFGLLVDFNGDGIEDMFKDPQVGGIAGIEVWRGKRDANGLYYELVEQRQDYFNIMYYLGNGNPLNVYNSPIDIPAIVDVDGDGDVDVLSFEIDGSFLNYYRNYAIEQNLGQDTFVMKFEKLCFGGFKETMFSSDVILNDEMDGCAEGIVSNPNGNGGPRHAGSTVNAFDGDCDGDIDVLLGDFLTSTIVYLENGGSAIKDWITNQDSRFPSYDESAMMEVFLSTFYLDINNDGKRDLIVTPNQEDVGKNQNHVWLYLNEGTDCGPIFKLHTKEFLIDEMLHFSRQSHPQFLDYNADGLLDILIGNGGEIVNGINIKKRLYLLRNTGSLTNPAYTVLDEDYLNFGDVPDEIARIAPDLADIDNDGDMDLFLGNSAGDIFYYENTAGPGAEMKFKDPVAYYQELFVGGNSSPDFYDLNKDGLLDLAIGESNNEFDYFENIGTPTNPEFNSDLSIGNNSKNLGNIYGFTDPSTRHGSPTFFFSEGNTYLLLGVADGRLRLYGNISVSPSDTFQLLNDQFGQIYNGERVTCDIADINGDNKYDLVVGNDRGGIHLYSTDIEVGKMVAVDEKDSPQIKLAYYPNPVRDFLYLNTDQGNGIIMVNDMKGNLVLRKEMHAYHDVIHTANWNSGMYIVTFISSEGTVSTKVVKH